MAKLLADHYRTAFYLLAAIPFLLSIVFSAVGAAPREVTEPENRPALVFNQYLVNLGPVELRNEHFARFVFRNKSNVTVKIKELRPSCGCLNPQLPKKSYEPGETGEFFLRVRAATEQPGSKEYYCDVVYEDTQPRETRITFKLILPEKKISVEPRALVFYQPNAEPTTRDITVTDYRNGHLELLGAESSSNLAHVAIGETQIGPQGMRHNKVRITVTQVPAGTHDSLITIFTDDPEFPELKVPIRIVGPEEPGKRVATEPTHGHGIKH